MLVAALLVPLMRGAALCALEGAELALRLAAFMVLLCSAALCALDSGAFGAGDSMP